jgi:uncharacterized protein (TIGR04222 family)
MLDGYHLAGALLLVAALAVRFARPGTTLIELRPTEVALLRGGRRAAVITALVLLHARAAVDGHEPGRAQRCGPLPRGCDPLARVVYAALVRPANPRELVRLPNVRRALAELSTHLAAARLTVPAWRRLALGGLALASIALAAAGWAAQGATITGVPLAAAALATLGLAAMSRRTWRGRRTVRGLRRRYADLTVAMDAADWSPRSLGLAVALHGNPALRLTLPTFAAQGGLLRDRAA